VPRKERLTRGESLSNTSYGKCLDCARFQWLLKVCGPPMGPEKAWSPLAGTNYVFLKEIALGAAFEIDVHVASWDDKWVRLLYLLLPLGGD